MILFTFSLNLAPLRSIFHYDLIYFSIFFQFLRSRVGGSQISNKPFYKLTSPDDCTLLFESRFECGNLLRAIKVLVIIVKNNFLGP